MLSPKELDVLAIAASPGKLATDKQSIVIMAAHDRLRKEGCPFGPK